MKDITIGFFLIILSFCIVIKTQANSIYEACRFEGYQAGDLQLTFKHCPAKFGKKVTYLIAQQGHIFRFKGIFNRAFIVEVTEKKPLRHGFHAPFCNIWKEKQS